MSLSIQPQTGVILVDSEATVTIVDNDSEWMEKRLHIAQLEPGMLQLTLVISYTYTNKQVIYTNFVFCNFVYSSLSLNFLCVQILRFVLSHPLRLWLRAPQPPSEL